MRFQSLFDEGNEKELRELCMKYYKLFNEYSAKGIEEPPPAEISQKLGLHIEEYSELLIFLSGGGYDSLIWGNIQDDFNNGATFIDNPLTNIK